MARYLNQRFGDYQLVRLLGHGGFAEVYGALQVHLGTKAAIKILNDSFTPQQLAALREEARIVSELGGHPHIVRLLTFSIERNIPYLVMSYAPGGSLDRRHPRGKPLPLPTVVTYVRQIAAALQYAHERLIIHRDIKPANFLLTQDGRVQVADFGIALMAQNSQLWVQQEIAGTWTYMAPEQFQGHAVPASDQYALAIVVYQWLCGEPPFADQYKTYTLPHQHMYVAPPSLRDRNPAIPVEIERVLLKALAKRPEERFANIQEFARALELAAHPPESPIPGQRLGDYQLIRPLGSGAFAEVYEAEHVHLGTKAAIKILKGQFTAGQVETLRQLARQIIELDHPHIVRLHNFSVERMRPYLVMAYAGGGTLASLHAQNQPLPMETIIVYVRQIVAALQYAHDRHIAHRDIHPENLLLSQDGRVLVAGFGTIAMASTTMESNAQWVMGNWHYMAPEQFNGQVTPLSDQYALAILVYRWLLGELPFTGEGSIHSVPYEHLTMPPPSLHEKIPTLPPSIEQVILKALAKQPEERFASIQAFANALEQAYQTPPAGTTLLTYEHKGGEAKTIAWSPDGRRIASGGTDATVRIWDATVGKTLLTLRGHASCVQAVAWSPDGLLLASASTDQTVHVWEAATGRLLLRYNGHTDQVYTLAWSPNGHLLASAGWDQMVLVWEAINGHLVRRYEAHTDQVYALVWSPDGRLLASASADQTVQVWEATTGHLLQRYTGHTERVLAVAWSPNGRWLASLGSMNQKVHVWEAITGQLLRYYENQTERVHALACSPPEQPLLAPPKQTGTDQQQTTAWSPDRSLLALAIWDKKVQVWETMPERLLRSYEGHQDRVNALAWSPNGSLLASASQDKTVHVWEAPTGRQIQRYLGHTAAVHVVAWSPDGRLIASGSADKTVQVWEATTGHLLRYYSGHSAAVQVVAWSPNGHLLASASADKIVQVWETTTGRLLQRYTGHSAPVNTITWSPDGCWLTSTSTDKMVHVWQAITGRLLHRYRAYATSKQALAWSPDGYALASASNNGIVRIWETSSPDLLLTYRGHHSMVDALAWSPDGKRIASGGAQVHVWQAR